MKKKNSWKMPVRHSEQSQILMISTRIAMPSTEKNGDLEMDVDFCKRAYKQLGIPIPERH